MTIDGLALIIQSRHDPNQAFLASNVIQMREVLIKKFKEFKTFFCSSKTEIESILNRFKGKNIRLLILSAHGDKEKEGLDLGNDNFLLKEDIASLELSNVQEAILHSCSVANSIGVALSQKIHGKVWASSEIICQIYLSISPQNELHVLFSPTDSETNPYNLLTINNTSKRLEIWFDVDEPLEPLQNEVIKLIKENKIDDALNRLNKIEAIIASMSKNDKYSDQFIEKQLIYLSNFIYFPLFNQLVDREDYLGAKNLFDKEISLASALQNKVCTLPVMIAVEVRMLHLAERLLHKFKFNLIEQIFYKPLDLSSPTSYDSFMEDIIYGYLSIKRFEKAAELILNDIEDEYLKNELMIYIANLLLKHPIHHLPAIIKLNEILSKKAEKELDKSHLIAAEQIISLITFPPYKNQLLQSLIIKHLENENLEKAQELASQIFNDEEYKDFQQKIPIWKERGAKALIKTEPAPKKRRVKVIF